MGSVGERGNRGGKKGVGVWGKGCDGARETREERGMSEFGTVSRRSERGATRRGALSSVPSHNPSLDRKRERREETKVGGGHRFSLGPNGR
eukprot:scaffold152708_cov35-Tisochrysis_lutea.AAC.3